MNRVIGKGKKKVKSGKAPSGDGVSVVTVPVVPMTKLLTLRGTQVFRFAASGALSAVSIQTQDLLGLYGIATSATGVTAAFSGVSIKWVRLWVPSSAPSQQSIQFNWVGLNYVRPELYVGNAIGSALPATMEFRPPPKSDCGMWITTNMGSAVKWFVISCPSSTVVSVKLTYEFQNGTQQQTGAPLTYTSSGLTAGYMYYGMLDKSSGAPKLAPGGNYYG